MNKVMPTMVRVQLKQLDNLQDKILKAIPLSATWGSVG